MTELDSVPSRGSVLNNGRLRLTPTVPCSATSTALLAAEDRAATAELQLLGAAPPAAPQPQGTSAAPSSAPQTLALHSPQPHPTAAFVPRGQTPGTAWLHTEGPGESGAAL